MKTISNDMFFVRLKQLCKLQEPFSLVIAAVQLFVTCVGAVTFCIIVALHSYK